MAMKFDAPSIKRIDEFTIDPRELEVKPELNGRHDLPEIDDLVEGFLTLGQLQSCLVGKDGGRMVLYAGHRRWRAAMKITMDKLLPDGSPFKLRCRIFTGTETEAFLATIAENHDRKDTTPLDDAYNIGRLKRWNMSDEEIAAVYRQKTPDGKPDVKWVQQRAALIDLAPEAAKALSEGRMKPTAAVAIAKLSKDAQRSLIAESGEGKIKAPKKEKKVLTPVFGNEHSAESQPIPVSSKIRNRDAREMISEILDSDIELRVEGLTSENAVRVILGELYDALEDKC